MNFDGLSGPTHFFGGLSYGNVASMTHMQESSNPKKAALQGLSKMKFMMDLGAVQALLPPHERPSIVHLRECGFSGCDADVLSQAAKEAPLLLAQLSSSSSMWAANAATVTPSIDAQDGQLHLSIANLLSTFHRSVESDMTYKIFKKIFPQATIHPPLPKGGVFGDEGAANHIRLGQNEESIHLFVYGSSLQSHRKTLFPARQCKEASEAIIRRHKLSADRVFLVKQNPKAIEKGVFHNDVISMGHENLFLYHEMAFAEEIAPLLLEKLPSLQIVKIKEISLEEAVRTYLFNSQIFGKYLIAPLECQGLDLSFLPFEKIHYMDLGESMKNGGGPACLRLRVVMNEEERERVHPYIFLTEKLYGELVEWVERYFRDHLTWRDLADPVLLQESREALDELTKLLQLGSLYSFQA